MIFRSIFLQVGEAVPSSLVDLVLVASTEAKFVLAILVVLSLISWTVMLAKWLELRRVRSIGRQFEDEFARVSTMENAAQIARRLGRSPYASVVDRAMEFVTNTKPGIAATADRAGRLSASQVEALRLVLDGEISEQRDTLARFIPSLAVIGSASPLIGLLGTVLGVIDAFLGIGRSGSGNLAAVAPGIAEALIATAVALAVAIPAVFGYNIFASRLNRIEGALDGFGSELIALMVHEGRI
jgi:biopolymer transport protein TolQ